MFIKIERKKKNFNMLQTALVSEMPISLNTGFALAIKGKLKPKLLDYSSIF